MNAVVATEFCHCTAPEPVLIDHGLGSLCEKCGQRILQELPHGKK